MMFGIHVCQVKVLPLRHVDDVWYTCMSGQEDVSRARMVAPLSTLLSCIPLMNFIGECL